MYEIFKNSDFYQVILIIFAVEGVAVFVFKYLKKLFDLRQNNEDFHEKVDKHEREINEIKQQNERQNQDISLIKRSIILDYRGQLVRDCLFYIRENYIDSKSLDSILERYEFYHNQLHQNSYVTELVDRIRELEIRDN